MNSPLPLNKLPLPGQLVTGEELLRELFTAGSRPTLRWLRRQVNVYKSIPCVQIGRFVRFDPARVRAHLERRHTLNRNP